MEKAIVTQELLDRVLDLLTAQTSFPRELFYCEIQDDFQLLFISIPIDDFTDIEVTSSLKRIAQIMNSVMPVRTDDYSWVVGLKRQGEVVDSCFGGNLATPNWEGCE